MNYIYKPLWDTTLHILFMYMCIRFGFAVFSISFLVVCSVISLVAHVCLLLFFQFIVGNAFSYFLVACARILSLSLYLSVCLSLVYLFLLAMACLLACSLSSSPKHIRLDGKIAKLLPFHSVEKRKHKWKFHNFSRGRLKNRWNYANRIRSS